MLRWSLCLKEAKAKPTQLHRLSHGLIQLLYCWGILAPPANTDHFCTSSEPTLLLPWSLKPLLLGSDEDQAKKSPRKESDFSPSWNTRTKSSESPCRVLFSLQQYGLHTDIFEPALCPRNPMQNGVVWVLQMGSRDWLWEPDTVSGWAEEITCFQQLQDGCQRWKWSKCNFKARKWKGFGAAKPGPHSSRQP